MTAEIRSSSICGTVKAPSSKSLVQRALAASLIHSGSTVIQNFGGSADELATLKIIQQLGAVIEMTDRDLRVSSPGFPNTNVRASDGINFGESGLAARMFTPIISLSSEEFILRAEGTLVSRPFDFFDTLRELNIDIRSSDKGFPICVRGPLEAKNISINASATSQFLTGLLFAFSAAAKREVEILVANLKSKPYIDLTVNILKHFGFDIRNHNYKTFEILPLIPSGETVIYAAEGDWSGAAFIMVAAATCGSVTVAGLDHHSAQADKMILKGLTDCGAAIVREDHQITVSKNQLKAFNFDATDCPDLFPPLVALAASCRGISHIEGVSRLKGKESDRGAVLQSEFRKAGIEIYIKNDVMSISGGTIQSAEMHSFCDHRIVMAAAVAGLRAQRMLISNAEAVHKSYPHFFNDLQHLGASVTLK